MIDTKAIKNKILGHALHGQLTDHLPEDGTADELYQTILLEKNEILKSRGGKKDKDIKPIDDNVPFNLPQQWKWIRLGDIGLFRKGPFGSALTKSIFVSKSHDTIKVYEQQNAIKKDCSKGNYYITRKYFDDKMKGFEVCAGDIIVSCAGTIGETYIIPDGIEQGIINQALMRIILVNSVDKHFFLYYFDAYLKKSANDQSNGSTINNIPPFDILKNWYFPLPPLAEQKRIVERIDAVFPILDTIDVLQTRYANDLTVLKNKLIDAAIQGKLTEQRPEDGTAEELYQQIQAEKQALINVGKLKDEKPLPEISSEKVPFPIPDRWRWVYLGELFQHNTGKALNASNTHGQMLEYITTSNLYWDRFELNNLKSMPFEDSEIEKCTIKKGDLLICEGGDIGRSAIWPFDFEMRIQNHIHKLRKFSTTICTKFYYYLLWHYKQTGKINGIGIGLQGFSSRRVHSLIVPLPPFAEQKRIVAKLDEALKIIEQSPISQSEAKL